MILRHYFMELIENSFQPEECQLHAGSCFYNAILYNSFFMIKVK